MAGFNEFVSKQNLLLSLSSNCIHAWITLKNQWNLCKSHHESLNFISCHNKAHKKKNVTMPSGHKTNYPTTDLLQLKLSNR